MQYTKTELHTHLVGMLSGDGFLRFLNSYRRYTDDILHWPTDYDEPIEIVVSNIVNNPDFINDLEIKFGKQIRYDEMNNYYNKRTELLKELSKKFAIKNGISNKNAEKIIYNDYINRCLSELVKQGVEYVEISYSIFSRIKSFEIDSDLSDKIKCKFLLSTQRSNDVSSFKKSAVDLKKLLEQGVAVGFDIMGEERKLRFDELDYNNVDESFKRKLEVLFDALLKYDNTTLRIHSGETNDSFTNTMKILEFIEEISYEKNIIIPPPEIRIGHGLYFDKNLEYVEKLKKFGCIIEINASSNFALGNIKDYSSLPYEYYIKNEIPVVLSTDGHGLYSTSIVIEDHIAERITDKNTYDEILTIDETIRDRKGR